MGAVGSMLAKTLVKCGCTNISLLDYDLKKPENICRSEYTFLTGVTDKVTELSAELSAISPYVEVKCLSNQCDFAIKSSKFNKQCEEYTINELESYDLIFDCSTDDDLMHILEELNLKSEIVNISITNHASELVCAFSLILSTLLILYSTIYCIMMTQICMSLQDAGVRHSKHHIMTLR